MSIRIIPNPDIVRHGTDSHAKKGLNNSGQEFIYSTLGCIEPELNYTMDHG